MRLDVKVRAPYNILMVHTILDTHYGRRKSDGASAQLPVAMWHLS